MTTLPFPRFRGLLWNHRAGLLVTAVAILLIAATIWSGIFDVVGYTIDRTTGYAQNNNQINYAVGTIDYSLRVHYAINPPPDEGDTLYTAWDRALAEAKRLAAHDAEVYRSGDGDPAPFPGIRALVITVRGEPFDVLGNVPFN